jgi:DNA-directed RNA polymerase subunit RPC12/RpoP
MCFSSQNNNTTAVLKCDICGEEWSVILRDVMRGYGCPYCHHKRVSKNNNLFLKFPEICKDWNYDKNESNPSDFLPFSNRKVWWKCSKCGNEWNASINSRTGKGKTDCPNCRARSKCEVIIEKYLKKNNICFMPQYKIDDCKNIRPLPFDFAIFNNDNDLLFLLEYDGELHFRGYNKSKSSNKKLLKTQKNDKIKNKYCKDNNIRLLRISYKNKNRMLDILEKELGLLKERR